MYAIYIYIAKYIVCDPDIANTWTIPGFFWYASILGIEIGNWLTPAYKIIQVIIREKVYRSIPKI